METYQLVALAVMVGMGFVVHTTVALNGLRKRMGVPKQMFNFRDLRVLRRPDEFEEEEVRAVRTNWAARGALFVLVLLLIATVPPDLPQQLGPPPLHG